MHILLSFKVVMHMKGEDGNIWNSIQLLKRKLRNDRQQLEDIKNDLSRGKSSSLIRNKSVLEKSSNEKENQPALANLNCQVSEYRKRTTVTPNKPDRTEQHNSISLIELRKQHKNTIKQLNEAHTRELESVRESAKIQIENLRAHYESIIQEKDSHIRLLEDTLAKELCHEMNDEGTGHQGDQPLPNQTYQHKQIQSIKEQYESEMQRMKQKYQAIIGNLSEQNQDLTARQLHTHQSNPSSSNDVTFKNVRMLLKNSTVNSRISNHQRLVVRIAESENHSFMSRQEEIGESKLAVNQQAKVSMAEDRLENNLYRLFKDKFKFNKKSLQASSNVTSRSSLVRENKQTREWERESLQESSKQSGKSCTLQQVWQSWVGSEQHAWQDREIHEQSQLQHSIRNIQISLLN